MSRNRKVELLSGSEGVKMKKESFRATRKDCYFRKSTKDSGR